MAGISWLGSIIGLMMPADAAGSSTERRLRRLALTSRLFFRRLGLPLASWIERTAHHLGGFAGPKLVNMETLDKFITRFLPSNSEVGTDEHRRKRMFLISHLFGPCFGLPIAVLLYISDPDPNPHVPILGASLSLFLLFPFLVKLLPRHYEALALLSVQNLIFAILWGSYHYGGASSPFLIWFAVVPLLAFFYLGSHAIARVVVFSQIVAGLGLFYFVRVLNPDMQSHIPVDNLVVAGIFSTLGASIYVFVMASYYARIVDSQSELLREISRHGATLSKLTEAKNEAERANNAKSEFLAKMSHELRTPLNAVLGYSEILLEDAELEGSGEKIADLEKISAAGKHLLSMVNDILDMSKIEAGKMDLFPVDVDLDKLFNEIDVTSRPMATKNTNTFNVIRSSGPLGTICIDATKLRQVVLNLISNSGKFTQNGAITLYVRRDKGLEGGWIEIVIADSGIGISAEQQKVLFSKFTQANPMIASKFGGTGLGLSLSRNLCQLMGGDISIESAPGRGSQFTIRLPTTAIEHSKIADGSTQGATEEPESVAAKSLAEMDALQKGRKRVLIVDDDRAFLELAERMLMKEGFNAICTDVPSSALQVARTMKPDVVLLDILMPEFDGWRVLDALKTDPVTNTIPVVVLSVTDQRKRALDAGAFAVLARPADRLEFINIVKAACHQTPSAPRIGNPIRKVAAHG